MTPFDILDKESQAVFAERIHKWLAGEKPPENVEYRVITKEGREIHAVLNVTFTRDEQGAPLGATVVGYDITERKKSEEALARSNAQLNEVLDSIQDDFYVLDREWRFVYASRSFTGRIGKEPKDFIGNCIWEMFPKNIGSILEKHFRASMEKGEIRRFEYGGRYTSAWYSMTSFPSPEGITVLGTDITDRKVAEHELAQARLEAEQRAGELEAIMEAVPVGMMLTRDPGRNDYHRQPGHPRTVAGTAGRTQYFQICPRPGRPAQLQAGQEW